MILDDWQKEYLETKGNVIVMGGRQIGKSEIESEADAIYLMNTPNAHLLIVSGVEKQASSLFDKILEKIKAKNPRMIMQGKDRPIKTVFKLHNGAVCRTEPVGTDGSSARRHTLTRIVFEEMQLIPEEAYAACTPMLLTTGGEIRMLGTAWGCEGYVYDRLSDPDFKVFWIDAEKVAEKRPEPLKSIMLGFLEKEKKRLTISQYEREYKAIPQKSLKQFFDDNLVKRLMILKRPSDIRRSDYFGGSDIAAMGEDETTFEILDARDLDNIKQVENIVANKLFPYQTAEKIINLNEAYHFDSYGIDDGGLGIDVLGLCLKNDGMRRKIKALNNSKKITKIQNTKMEKPHYEDEKEVTLLKEDMYCYMLSLMEQNKIKFLDDEEIRAAFKSVLFEIDKETKKMRVYGNRTHIIEGLVRACWCTKDKSLNIWIKSI